MLPRRRLGTVTVLILLLWGLLALNGPAAAQEGDGQGEPPVGVPNERGITLTVRAGFDGFHKGEGWLPVQVTLANNGPPLEGELVVENRVERTAYRLPVSLPTQSNKRLEFPAYAITAASGLRISLEENGEEIAAALSNPLKSLPSQSGLLFGVVSTRPDALEFLEKVTGVRTGAGVAFLTIDELPAASPLWRDLDVLILNDVDSNRLSAGQRAALESWLRLGGQLVVTGGAGWQKSTTAVAEWLPVTVTGSRSVEDLPALARAAGEPFRDPGPYVVAESTLRSGELLVHEDGLPLLARRPLGRGMVYFLALDPQFAPLDDWDGSPALWTPVANAVPREAIWESGFANEAMAGDAVSTLPALILPSALLLGCFVGLYVLLVGPGNYFLLRRMRRRELAWVTIPSAIVVFSLIAYVIGLQFKGNSAVVNQMSIVSGRVGVTTGEVTAAVAVYSPRRQAYDIFFEEDVLLHSLDSYISGFSDDDLVIEGGGATILRNTLIDVGGVATYQARAQRPLPAIEGEVTLGSAGSATELNITVENGAGFPLENAMLLIGGRAISLGEIAPGQRIERQEPLPPSVEEAMREAVRGAPLTYTTVGGPTSSGAGVASPASSYSPSPLESYYTTLLGTSSYYGDREIYPRFQLLESLYDNYGGMATYQPEGVVLLLGWSTEPQLAIDLGSGRFESSAVTLYVLELPFD